MSYDNSDRGVLFKNTRKEPGSKQPDYRGNGNFNGQDFKISGWIQTPKNGGDKFISFKFEPADEQLRAREPAKEPEPVADEVPF